MVTLFDSFSTDPARLSLIHEDIEDEVRRKCLIRLVVDPGAQPKVRRHDRIHAGTARAQASGHGANRTVRECGGDIVDRVEDIVTED